MQHQTCRMLYVNMCPLRFKATPLLCAEPLKKRRKIDPQILKMREERKKRRIEKQIKKLERSERQLKPVDEMEVPPHLFQEKEVRTRHLAPITQEEQDGRISLKKRWSEYKYEQFTSELNMIDRMISSQTKALEELRLESEELYKEAIQIDPVLIPYQTIGPVRTPPVKDYDSPDGMFIDVTRKWH